MMFQFFSEKLESENFILASPESIAGLESVAGPSSLLQNENQLTITEIDDVNGTNDDIAGTLMPPLEDIETTQNDEDSNVEGQTPSLGKDNDGEKDNSKNATATTEINDVDKTNDQIKT